MFTNCVEEADLDRRREIRPIEERGRGNCNLLLKGTRAVRKEGKPSWVGGNRRERRGAKKRQGQWIQRVEWTKIKKQKPEQVFIEQKQTSKGTLCSSESEEKKKNLAPNWKQINNKERRRGSWISLRRSELRVPQGTAHKIPLKAGRESKKKSANVNWKIGPKAASLYVELLKVQRRKTEFPQKKTKGIRGRGKKRGHGQWITKSERRDKPANI